VTLSEGEGQGERAPNRRSGAILTPLAPVFGALLVTRDFYRRLWMRSSAAMPGVMGE